MNTTRAQHKALDDALVALADRLEFRKCNMRLKTDFKPKEATFQVVMYALALTLFYRTFLIPVDVLAIYMQEFWAIVSIHRQVFEDLTLEQDILSFIKDLGHTRGITYLTDVNVDYLHQPWRAFATVINKCLSDEGIGTKPEGPDVPPYESESNKESWGDSEDEDDKDDDDGDNDNDGESDDHDDDSDDERTKSDSDEIPDLNQTNVD
nr:hypothetical protein [Tanacetum cinerariifolium]